METYPGQVRARAAIRSLYARRIDGFYDFGRSVALHGADTRRAVRARRNGDEIGGSCSRKSCRQSYRFFTAVKGTKFNLVAFTNVKNRTDACTDVNFVALLVQT